MVEDFVGVAPALVLEVLGQVVLLELGVHAVEVGEDAILVHFVLFGELQVLDGLALEFLAENLDLCLGHAVRDALDGGVDGAVDGNAVGVERIFAVLLFHVLADFLEEVETGTRFRFLFGQDDGRIYILVVFFLADVAGVVHGVEHCVAAFERCLRVAVGAVGLGCLEHAGEDGVFRDGEAVERMAEVVLACSLETVVTAAQVHLVHVEFEDFLLGVGLLDADGGHRLLDLTGNGTFRREEQELGQLLREGGGATELLVAQCALNNGGGDGPHVHAPVLVEGAVFGGHHGVDGIFGDGIKRCPFAAFHKVFMSDLPVHVVDVGDELRIDLFELGERREFGQVMVVDDDDRSESGDNGEAEDGKADDELLVGELLLCDGQAAG